MKKIKPRVSGLVGRYTLEYICGSCGAVFDTHISKDYNYCPYCGKPIDWGIIETVNEEWAQEYLSALAFQDDKRLNRLYKIIDNINNSLPEDQRTNLVKTPLTKQTILENNINHYLKEGWTEEELIEQGFFTREQLDKYN